MSKAQRIAALEKESAAKPAESPFRRKGVDKSRIASNLMPTKVLDLVEEDIPATQLMDEDGDFVEESPLLDDEESDDVDDEFNEQAEEIFLGKTDAWFAEYAPKLFALEMSKFLTKQAKKEQKQTEESSSTKRRPSKRRKTSS